MKKITLLFALILVTVTGSFAQVGGYVFNQPSGTYNEISGGTILGTDTNDDNSFNAQNIGFNFVFNNVSYTQISINSNGFIAMGATVSSANTALSTGTSNNVIAALNGDLQANTTTGELSYGVLGASPNQIFTVQWKNYRAYNVAGDINNFQIKLYETTNVIQIVYGDFTQNATNRARQVGLRGGSNIDFNNRTTISNWVATTVGTVNTATVALRTAIIPTSGLTFKWTPPVICTGTPVAGSIAPTSFAICNGSLPGNITATGYTSGASGLNFQWEQSSNSFATAGVNAVGGSGATTTVYAPPAYTGTPIQYRLKVTCSGSGLFAYSNISTINNPAAPTTQVSNLVKYPTSTTAPLYWANGNGGRRVVYFSDSPTFVDPVNGNTSALVATVAYSGSGQQIVFDGTLANVTVTGLVVGTTYYAKVYEYLRCGAGPYDYYYNTSTATNIATIITALPANDNITNATPISCGSVYTGNTTEATLDEANPALQFGVDLDSPNVWFTFTGTGAAQTVSLNLCQSTYDTSVLIFTGTPGALTAIAGNDDDGTCGNTFASKANFTSNGTSTYYIVVEGFNAASVGGYNMSVSCVALNPPAVANQTCATSLAVTVNGTNLISDNSYGDSASVQPSCDSFGAIQDVWFSFVAPVSGSVDCSLTNGTMSSLNFNVYSGTCAALTPVVNTCNSNLTVNFVESLTALVAGDTYFVQVWSNAAEQGTFTLNLADAPLKVDSFDTTNFLSYPNPVQDILNLSYTKNISSVSVHNLLGQQVVTKTINASQAKIDLSNLSNGTYLVKVNVDGLIKTLKVIKE